MLQRARMLFGDSLVKDHIRALMASKYDPIASGRHKVFGSLPLNVPPQTSTIASHLPKAIGTAFSISLVKSINVSNKKQMINSVFCNFGDASFNHSTAQGAFNAASWIASHHLPLPILFCCEDNQIGISVPTSPCWIETMISHNPYIVFSPSNYSDVPLHYKNLFEA